MRVVIRYAFDSCSRMFYEGCKQFQYSKHSAGAWKT